MPIRHVRSESDHLTTYYLVSFDKYGKERQELDGTYLSKTIVSLITSASPPYTDIFFISHGWKKDVPKAIEFNDEWIGAMVSDEVRADIEAAHKRIKGFKPLIIGLHWPSQPWGDEEMVGNQPLRRGGGVLGDTEPDASLEERVETCAAATADSPAAKDAIRTLLEAADVDPQQRQLSPETGRALATLVKETGIASETTPREELVPLDDISEPSAAAATGPGVLGLGDTHIPYPGLITTILRQLSFWTMKDRARVVGESGGHQLLRSVQGAAGKARIHLMGHSFGCIVVSAITGGSDRNDLTPIPVTSLFLSQGALSLWSFCPSIPFLPGTPGHFYPLIRDGLVQGSIVTTLSSKDMAVGSLYPLAAKMAKQIVLGDKYPEYGGMGTWGIQGVPNVHDLVMKPANGTYDFRPKHVYNLDGSNVIKHGLPPSGGHNDIAHPEVAHAFWAAVLAGQGGGDAPGATPANQAVWVNAAIPASQASASDAWRTLNVSVDQSQNPSSTAAIPLALQYHVGGIIIGIQLQSDTVRFSPSHRNYQVSSTASHPQSFNFRSTASGGKVTLTVLQDGNAVGSTDFSI